VQERLGAQYPTASPTPPTGRAALGSALGERGEDLVLLGEASFRLLREDEVAVGENVELTLRALDDTGVDPAVLQRGRETRGPTVVTPSDGAVEDLDAHAESLLIEPRPMPFDDPGGVDTVRERAVGTPSGAVEA
jgi:hypothetical protein